jgi:mitochondrial chaperone BCS1
VTALAGELRVPIVLVALGSQDCGDRDIASALERAPRFSIVLIEDVDCAFIPDETMSPNDEAYMRHTHVTLSGLLNAIDGVAAQDGRILFMTTNHKDQLSEALIRPGRVDVQYELGRASKTGASNLFAQFFPAPSEEQQQPDHRARLEQARHDFVAQVDDGVHSFATLQGVLMQCRDEPEVAAEAMRRAIEEEKRRGAGQKNKEEQGPMDDSKGED